MAMILTHPYFHFVSTTVQTAAATLLRILERNREAGETRIWLGAEGRVALDELADATRPPDPRKILDKLATALRSEPKPDSLKNTMVFSTGAVDARVLFVGDAPGEAEEIQQKPFVGEAGQKLDGILRAMGLSRDEVYLTNVLKFAQHDPSQIPGSAEIDQFRPTLLAEIHTVNPDIVVALGAVALQGILGETRPIETARGRVIDFNGRQIIATYHPSYLLEQEAIDPERARAAKRALWEDMLLVMESLNLPISDKQRGFFK